MIERTNARKNNVPEKNGIVIQGLWIGDRIPVMQQLSIASFLTNGHEYHLYAYSLLKGLPEGAVLKDAEEIIPQCEVFRNSNQTTYAAFSDVFRYKLLLMKGGWWADLDMVCLRPFLFTDEYVFSSEHELCRERINSGVIKTPKGSEIMKYTWEASCGKDKAKLSWDEIGPDLVEQAVEHFSLGKYVRPAIVFCALPPEQWRYVLEPVHRFRFQKNTCAIHLWHEFWRRRGWDVDASYAPDCLYEQLKMRYLLKKPAESAKSYELL